MSLGTFPFGSPLLSVTQQDRTPKRMFVVGVYASAVHARWVGPEGKTLVNALAVASEPAIFWRGDGAARLISDIDQPEDAGHLEPAAPQFNGPAGRSRDEHFLAPLGVTRTDAWLCDLLPHACLNPSKQAAFDREYEPRRGALGLPEVTVPPVPQAFADDARRGAIFDEIQQADPKVLVLLGDQPIREPPRLLRPPVGASRKGPAEHLVDAEALLWAGRGAPGMDAWTGRAEGVGHGSRRRGASDGGGGGSRGQTLVFG